MSGDVTALPRRTSRGRPLRVSAVGAAASIPWCCILPALLAGAGMVSSLAGRLVASGMPVFLAVTIASFARAHYLLWARRHGSPGTRLVTVLLTLIATGAWAIRLSPQVADLVLR